MTYYYYLKRFFAQNLFVPAVVLSSGLFALPGAGRAENFAGYLANMLNNQPSLQASLYDVYSKGQLYDVSISQMVNPTVALISTYGKAYSVSTGAASAIFNTDATYYRNTQTLQLTQNLFNGGKDSLAIQQGRAVFHLSEWQYLAKEQDLILQSAVAYTNVIKARKAYQLQKWNNEMMTRTLIAARIRFKSGIITSSDLAQSEALKSGNDAAVISAQNNLFAAGEEFARLFGDRPSNNLDPIEPQLENIAKFINQRNDGSKESWVRDFQMRNPNLQQARLQKTIANIQKDSQLVSALPKVDFNLTASLIDTNQPNAARETKNFGGNITVTAPLWVQGAFLSGSQAVISAAKSADLQFLDTTQKLKVQFDKSYQDYQAAILAEQAYTDAVRSSRLALRAANIEYNTGKKTLLELMQAANSNLNNELNLLDTNQKKIMAVLGLQMMTGDLIAGNFGLRSPYRALTEKDRIYRGATDPFIAVSQWILAPDVKNAVDDYPKQFKERRERQP